MERATTDSTTHLRIFVRIGALKRFHQLKQKTAGLPVEVLWDRRGGRADHPARERRQDAPFTWEAADFVVVEAPPSTATDVGR